MNPQKVCRIVTEHLVNIRIVNDYVVETKD
jgi:(2Fe-2S) ferredoxin